MTTKLRCCCLLHDVNVKCSFKIVENEGILATTTRHSNTPKGGATAHQNGHLAPLRNSDYPSASNDSNGFASEVFKDMAWTSIPRFHGCDAQRMCKIHRVLFFIVCSTRLFHQKIMESFQRRDSGTSQGNVQAGHTKWLVLLAEQFAVHSIDQLGRSYLSSHVSAQNPYHCSVFCHATQETH